MSNTHLLNYEEFLKNQPSIYPAHEHHERKLKISEKIALFITEKIGSFWFFVFVLALVIGWCVWNMVTPQHWHFDDLQFNVWQFLSGTFQVITMPLIMVVQQIQLHHAEARSEFSYLAMKRSINENALIIAYLEKSVLQQENIIQLQQKTIEQLTASATKKRTKKRLY